MAVERRLQSRPCRTAKRTHSPNYLKSQMDKIGFNITVRAAPDFPTWRHGRRSGGHDFEVSMDKTCSKLGDPGDRRASHYSDRQYPAGRDCRTRKSYSNAKGSMNCWTAAAVELDMDKRKALLCRVQQIVVGESADLFLSTQRPTHGL